MRKSPYFMFISDIRDKVDIQDIIYKIKIRFYK